MKLIKLKDKFILVSDEEIKEGQILPYVMKWENGYEVFNSNNGIRKSKLNRAYKIIAGISELPSIDFSLLSEEDCKTIGWYDVVKLAEENWKSDKDNEELFPEELDENTFCAGFYDGFKTAQSINDKVFSLEDMKKAYNTNHYSQEDKDKYWKTFIQSLQQTSWDVEVDMEGYKKNGMIDEATSYRPKVTKIL